MNVSAVNDTLRGFTALRRLTFETLDGCSTYALRLDLAESESARALTLSVTFEDVSNLRLFDFGGGLTQIMYLNVVDIRDRQLDRACFEVSDHERQAISFACRSIRTAST